LKNIRWWALLLVGSAEAALAQTTASLPPVAGAAQRASAITARRLGIRAAVNAVYESNVFGVSRAVADTRGGGQSLDDYQISPSLQIDLAVPFGRQSAFLRGQIGYDFHLRNSQLNRERIGLNGGTNLAFGSCTSALSGSFARSRVNAGDIFAVRADPDILPGVLRLRNNAVTSYSGGVSVQCGSPIGLSPSISYQHSAVRNSSPLLKLNDSNQDSVEASIGYQRPALGRVSIFGSYSTATFTGRDIFFRRRDTLGFDPRLLDGVENYSAGLRFERDIGARLSGSLSVGYNWSNPKSIFSQRFRGSTYSANLAFRPSDRLSVDLTASRSASGGNSAFASFVITEVYSTNATYRLNEQLDLNAGTSLLKRDFRGGGLANDLSGVIGNDQFLRTYGGVNFDLNRRLSLNALVSHQERKADNSIFNFSNTTASVGVSLALGR
jgi:hypothetical protein